jgi:hypothetical protein
MEYYYCPLITLMTQNYYAYFIFYLWVCVFVREKKLTPKTAAMPRVLKFCYIFYHGADAS